MFRLSETLQELRAGRGMGVARSEPWFQIGFVEAIFFSACFFAALRPWVGGHASEPVDAIAGGFPGWTVLTELSQTNPRALSPRDAGFARQFPGKISAFDDGTYTWVARWIAQPTRKLHPAADCLRASGYVVHPEPIFAGNGGDHWGVVSAVRGPEKLTVRERIVDRDGGEFTDVSAWYWAAVLEKSRGPWWCLTRIDAGATSR